LIRFGRVNAARPGWHRTVIGKLYACRRSFSTAARLKPRPLEPLWVETFALIETNCRRKMMLRLGNMPPRGKGSHQVNVRFLVKWLEIDSFAQDNKDFLAAIGK